MEDKVSNFFDKCSEGIERLGHLRKGPPFLSNFQSENEKCGTAVVEDFLIFLLDSLPAPLALQIISRSFTGRASFTKYIIVSKRIDPPSIPGVSGDKVFLENSINHFFSSINNQIQESNYEDSVIAHHSKFREIVYNSFPGYLSSRFYEFWRQEELRRIQYMHREISRDNMNDKQLYKSLTFLQLFNPPPSKINLCAVLPIVEVEQGVPPASKRNRAKLSLSCGRKSKSFMKSSDFSLDNIPYPDILDVMNEVELMKLLRKDAWLFNLLCNMENIPISFTVASARPQTGGFPIIYANKEFETLTGFSRSEAVGKQPNFLQRHDMLDDFWEMMAVQEMEVALSQGNTFSTTLSHSRKNGERYRSFIYLKPIFNANDDYVYVMSVQFNVTDPVKLENAKIMSEKLLSDIPRKIGDDSQSKIWCF